MAKKDNKNGTTLSYIEDRIASLKSIKQKDLLQTKSKLWERKANMKEGVDPVKGDYRTQIGATVKMQKDAELLSAIPEWDFIPLDEQGRKHRKLINYMWDYYWLVTNTDKVLSDAIQVSTTNGTGIVEEGIEHRFKKVKVPKYNDEHKIEYEEKEELIYSGLTSRSIPFENFFINGTDIENSTEAIVMTYYDKDDYIAEKELDPNFKNIGKIKLSKMSGDRDGVTGNDFDDSKINSTVLEIRYFNSAKDEYIILANGIEVRNSPIPYTHKQLPFSLYIDNKADNRIYGIGEFELLEQHEITKNDLRTLLIKGVRHSIGIILKDEQVDIDADELFAGLGEMYETNDLEGIKALNFPVPISDISSIENIIDNDIIALTGINHKSQQLNPSETAEKTRSKNKSSQKRINKNIKDNSYSFFRRLAELRMANMQFLHSYQTKEIPIKGGTFNNDGTFNSETGTYGQGKITPELTKGKFLVLPITESMLGFSKGRKLETFLRFLESALKLVDDDGKKVYSATELGRLLSEVNDYDFEKLTQQDDVFKTPEKMLEALKQQRAGTAGTEADPNFVPPNQRGQSVPSGGLSGIAEGVVTEE